MIVTFLDTVVIGGGQSGLVTGYFLQQQPDLSFTILDAQAKIGGAWQHYYDSLRLFSPAKYSQLPGMDFPGDPHHYPTRLEVVQYLRDYAAHFDLPLQMNTRVETVTREGDVFAVKTMLGDIIHARTIVSASGPFNTPNIPNIPGQEAFKGETLHSFEYSNPDPYHDQHVVVVGGRDSAMQVAADLAPVARVTMAARHELAFTPIEMLGLNLFWWLHGTGFDTIPLGDWKELHGSHKIIELQPYSEMVKSGNLAVKPMFTRFTENGVVWADGTAEAVDTVVFGTGYKPGLGYLTALGALDANGRACHHRGISERVPGLFYVGLFGQRSHSSATLRGVGKDAKFITAQLVRYLQDNPMQKRIVENVE